ncbi:hypothetical protein ILP92_04615 [Maribius pontilimi]|uniref:DUF6285 domain-containing protein n=1 Tax=Palleronia pontilimi TaxID=1964209 RepID=A0A934IHL5_9RHOB|nr:DUF6285 domain-containing protein [Palleronia pontilimi]MBJ3762029.1 hypothetical protein [Palleronia pontilimi]
MRDAPFTADLIATARAELKAAILPQLSGDAAYAGAMVANALGIALRDLEGDDGADAAERAALRALLDCDTDDLARLNADFADGLRQGRFDPGQDGHDAARRILWMQTRARLARVKPAVLAARDETSAER